MKGNKYGIVYFIRQAFAQFPFGVYGPNRYIFAAGRMALEAGIHSGGFFKAWPATGGAAIKAIGGCSYATT